jgi:hypothetical protein
MAISGLWIALRPQPMTLVMPALVAGIHVLLYDAAKTWMAGTKPGHDGQRVTWWRPKRAARARLAYLSHPQKQF